MRRKDSTGANAYKPTQHFLIGNGTSNSSSHKRCWASASNGSSKTCPCKGDDGYLASFFLSKLDPDPWNHQRRGQVTVFVGWLPAPNAIRKVSRILSAGRSARWMPSTSGTVPSQEPLRLGVNFALPSLPHR